MLSHDAEQCLRARDSIPPPSVALSPFFSFWFFHALSFSSSPLSLSVSLSLFFCALFFNPFSPLTAESGDALVHERGEKRKRARPQREKKSAKEEKVASSFFFSFSTSLFSHPPSLPSAPQTTNQRQASPAEAVKDAVEAVKDAVEDVKDAVVHAVEEAVSADDKEPAEAEAPPAVEVKVQTSPHDARFPATNQSRHCYTRYNEYYRCVAQKGEEDEECKFVSSLFLGFGISWGRERRRRRRRPEGGKNSPPFLFSLFYNNDNANNNSTSARTARSAPRSGSRSGRSSGRQASLFLYSPPFFSEVDDDDRLSRKGAQQLVSHSFSFPPRLHNNNKKRFLSTGAYAGKY